MLNKKLILKINRRTVKPESPNCFETDLSNIYLLWAAHYLANCMYLQPLLGIKNNQGEYLRAHLSLC